jgi:hypothetical protein
LAPEKKVFENMHTNNAVQVLEDFSFVVQLHVILCAKAFVQKDPGKETIARFSEQ